MRFSTIAIASLMLTFPFAISAGCDSDAEVSSSNSGGGSATGGGSASGGGSAAGGMTGAGGSGGATSGSGGIPVPTELAPCQGHIYECGDLVDNDMDGLLDSQDPDCLGPCDNTEDSFFGGIPGQEGPACTVDCYWDQDSGAGNDDCYWSHECDPNSVPPNYYPEPEVGDQCAYDLNANIPGTSLGCTELNAMQSQECHDFCGPLTPNGCDCFGCCEFPVDSGEFVWLGSKGANDDTLCTADALTDPTVCHPCQPVADCLNDCGKCEVCFGKPYLPPECFPGEGGSGAGGDPGEEQCPPELQACGQAGQEPCPNGFYCITGCCIELPN